MSSTNNFLLWIYLNLFFVNVLLYSSYVVIASMEIVSASQPLMFELLLFNVIFSLNHVKNHFFMLFNLFIFL